MFKHLRLFEAQKQSKNLRPAQWLCKLVPGACSANWESRQVCAALNFWSTTIWIFKMFVNILTLSFPWESAVQQLLWNRLMHKLRTSQTFSQEFPISQYFEPLQKSHAKLRPKIFSESATIGKPFAAWYDVAVQRLRKPPIFAGNSQFAICWTF